MRLKFFLAPVLRGFLFLSTFPATGMGTIPCHTEILGDGPEEHKPLRLENSPVVDKKISVTLHRIPPVGGAERATEGRIPVTISEANRQAVITEMVTWEKFGYELFDCRLINNQYARLDQYASALRRDFLRLRSAGFRWKILPAGER